MNVNKGLIAILAAATLGAIKSSNKGSLSKSSKYSNYYGFEKLKK